jgi:hypothetical protein
MNVGLFGITVGHIRPTGFIQVLRPEQILGFVTDAIKIVFNVQM